MRFVFRFYEHVEIISYFGKFRDSQDIGWIFCAYMMVLEKSPHLINQFGVLLYCFLLKNY